MGLFSFPKEQRVCGRNAVTRLFGSEQGGFAYPFRYLFIVEGAGDARGAGSSDHEAGAEEVAGSSDHEGNAGSGGCESGSAVLIAVPKRNLKRANKRNLVKRRTREAYRLQKSLLDEIALAKGVKVELALIYSAKEVLGYKTVSDAVGKILTQIGKRL